MSDPKRLIAVVGGTGHQGGAVVRTLQASGQLTIIFEGEFDQQ
jgi:uncharacterized protein YbjT (DUF2867 family)